VGNPFARSRTGPEFSELLSPNLQFSRISEESTQDAVAVRFSTTDRKIGVPDFARGSIATRIEGVQDDYG
jgi:hypothetical protein